MKLGAGAGLIACDKCSHHRDRAHFKYVGKTNIMNKHKRHFLEQNGKYLVSRKFGLQALRNFRSQTL